MSINQSSPSIPGRSLRLRCTKLHRGRDRWSRVGMAWGLCFVILLTAAGQPIGQTSASGPSDLSAETNRIPISNQENEGLQASASALIDPSKGHPFPRVAVFNWGGAPADWYARFDLGQVRSLPIDEIREINPNFIYLPTRDYNLVCNSFISCPEEWYLHDSQGNRISAGDYAAGHWANLSDLQQGAVNGQRLVDALPEYLKQLIQSSGSDGIATDGLYYRMHYSWADYRNLWPDVDLDRNGLNDRTEPGKGDAWVVERLAAGVDILLLGIEDMFESLPANPNPIVPEYGFLVNTGSTGSDLMGSPGSTVINGFLWEHNGADYGGTPDEDVAGTEPALFLDNNYATGPWNGEPPKNSFRSMRFGLARAMLRGDYFNFQDNDNAGGYSHYWDRYYDEFDLNVGYPTSDNQQIPGKSGVWVKFFDEGVAIANINSYAVTITDSDLRQLSGYAGPYWRFRGGQDPATNNGEQFDSVNLLGFTDNYAGGISGDGIILVSSPQTVVADIIIDNSDSGTSPGSSPPEFSGNWQEGCYELGNLFYTLRCAEWFDSFGIATTSDSNATATFRPTIGVSGDYEVFEWHGELETGKPATNVRYIIVDSAGQTTKIVNQSTNPGRWNSLGISHFDAGSSGSVTISAGDANGAVMADAVMFVYRGQSSSTTFADVPVDHWAYDAIETLYQNGYIAGCQTSPMRLYCPEAVLSRAEAAVFIVRGIHGADFSPPQPTIKIFDDVELEEWFADWTAQLWEDGYTSGCGTDPLIYCPLQEHTRGESMVFFLRMLNGKEYLPSEPTEPIYLDVPVGAGAPWYSKWVHAAFEEGLVQGCEDEANRGDLFFRPFDGLNRAEAACMMVHAKALQPFDSTPAIIDTFVVQPLSGSGPFTLTWSAHDGPEGSGIDRYEPRRYDGPCSSSSFGQWVLLDRLDSSRTSFQDELANPGTYCYGLRVVDQEGNATTEGQSGLDPIEVTRDAITSQGLPILKPNQGNQYSISLQHTLQSGSRYTFGDLDGDGLLDPVVKAGPLSDGNFYVDAYNYAGTLLWSHNTGIDKNSTQDESYIHEFVLVWDIDASAGMVQAQDGKWEVIYGYRESGGGWGLRIVSGEDGAIRKEAHWPAPAYGNHSPHYGTIAYLDGENPYIVVSAGLYGGGSVYAFDRDLNLLWTYDSPQSTGGHWLSAFDFDGDGKDEIVYGGTILNPNGTKRWSVLDLGGEGHMDMAQPGDLVPGNGTTEIFFCAEDGGTTLMVDQNGQIQWRDTETDFGDHCHTAWAADVDLNRPGDESCAFGNVTGEACYDASGNKMELGRGRPYDPNGDGVYSLARGDAAGDLNGDGGEENWTWGYSQLLVQFGTPGPSPRHWGNRGYMQHLAIFNSGYAPYEFTARNFGPTFEVRSE